MIEPQVDCIYVLTYGKRENLRWTNKWAEKMKGIFVDMESIFTKIKFDTGHTDLIPISIIPATNSSDYSLNELGQSFMYTQLLTEILLKIDYDYKSKGKLS